MSDCGEARANEGERRKECNEVLSLKRARARAHNLLKSELRRALESQRTKGTAVRGLRLY